MKSTSSKPLFWGYLLTLCGGFFWAVGGICGQLLFQKNEMTSNWLVPVRLTISGLILLAAALITRRDITSVWRQKRDRLEILLFGLLGSALCQYSYYTSIQYSNAAFATILAYTSPVLILAYTAFRSRRAPRLYELLCVVLVVLGAVVCSTHLNFQMLSVSPVALFWGVVCSVGMTIYTLEPRRLLQHHDLLSVVGWGMVIGGIALIPLCRPWEETVQVDTHLYIMLAAVILLGTVFSFCMYQAGVSIVGGLAGSVLSSVEPVGSVILSVLFLNIQFSPLDFLGFAMILITIPIIAYYQGKEQKETVNTSS
ncbi:MAG: DMT family transporter [Eubacteriales bacterium]|jgi:drug/metabolite transporter (DMT)-like permease